MTNNKYTIISDGKPIDILFYRITGPDAIVGVGYTRTIEPNAVIDEKITFKPEISWDYRLYIRSNISIYLSLESGERVGKLDKVFLQKKIHIE